MTLQKILHILAHGETLPDGFIARAQALLATLTGADHTALSEALARAQPAAETTDEKPDQKSK